jgi:signal transduction histidine kinase/DNA-binding NarL/FixJ family response regulator
MLRIYSPCAHMKHDKVFIIPERFTQFVPNSPNKLPWDKSEAFIGIPLFADGKSFAHFGMIWSEEGAAKRPNLSWGFIEMFLHSLEDMILQRLLEGRGFAKEGLQPAPARIIPVEAITASQSLRPYARNLSHELRTPMQGVVGMLDIMHSTVMDALGNHTTEAEKAVFEELKDNIELVQESSKRAVEAADNVVQAYDLNLQMPDTPLEVDEAETTPDHPTSSRRESMQDADVLMENIERPLSHLINKRERGEELDMYPGHQSKRLAMSEGGHPRAYRAPLMRTARGTSELTDDHVDIFPADEMQGLSRYTEKKSESGSPRSLPTPASPTRRLVVIREFMQLLVSEALKSSHSVQITTIKSENGEMSTVQTEGPRGEMRDLTINLITEPEVPHTIMTEEHHLKFALLKLVDNAIKFTESGSIKISLRLARTLVEIRVSDTGRGITDESKTHLFTPHFQEDASISRTRDGLGLSLFNAKAHVRKDLGGDMTLEHSATDGPSKGSEFLIRLPIFPSADGSRPVTPHVGTPAAESRSPYFHPETPHSVPLIEPTVSALPSIPVPETASRHPSPTRTPLIAPAPTPAKRSRFNASLASHIPLTILIAEDNVINRQILVGYLRKLGYPLSSIYLAFDGREAVSQYQRSLREVDKRKRINAVLMDLWMPNMDGYEAAEKILELDREWREREDCSDRRGDLAGDMRRDLEEEEVKVIAVTADVTSESVERAKRTGMRGFISKPYKVLDVEKLIVEHFRKGVEVGGR